MAANNGNGNPAQNPDHGFQQQEYRAMDLDLLGLAPVDQHWLSSQASSAQHGVPATNGGQGLAQLDDPRLGLDQYLDPSYSLNTVERWCFDNNATPEYAVAHAVQHEREQNNQAAKDKKRTKGKKDSKNNGRKW